MVHGIAEVPLEHGLDTAWGYLRDWATIGDWMPTLINCTAEPLAVGAVRTVCLKEKAFGKDQLVERIVALDATGFTYDVEGGLGPFRRLRTTWRVDPRGHVSMIVVETFTEDGLGLRLLAPLVRRRLDRLCHDMAHAFAKHVDTKTKPTPSAQRF